ncbi:MAG: HIT domain-containing protein [Candidatus Nanoarchaeia archaeon]|nr:HIT domain-containing protein [Candidatus Nanoarchaeia archaeon]MDD5239287.1 HIT domain-containing protein [Candidatus Nanoarchaeia archaeon]
MENCIFCALSQGSIPSQKVYEDEKFFAFLDINPANPGHLVLATKAHFRTIMEMGVEDYSHFFVIARALSLALLEFGAEGVNFLHSMGEAAGQRVPHVILHIIPRYKSDSVHLVWDPQKMDEAKLSELRTRISAFIKAPQQQVPVYQAPAQQQMPQQPAPQKPAESPVYQLRQKTGGYW